MPDQMSPPARAADPSTLSLEFGHAHRLADPAADGV